MIKEHFHLYVSSKTAKHNNMIKELESEFNKRGKGNYDIETIVASGNLEMVEKDNIIATPTLLRKSPLPEKMIIGGLEDTDKVINYFDQ